MYLPPLELGAGALFASAFCETGATYSGAGVSATISADTVGSNVCESAGTITAEGVLVADATDISVGRAMGSGLLVGEAGDASVGRVMESGIFVGKAEAGFAIFTNAKG